MSLRHQTRASDRRRLHAKAGINTAQQASFCRCQGARRVIAPPDSPGRHWSCAGVGLQPLRSLLGSETTCRAPQWKQEEVDVTISHLLLRLHEIIEAHCFSHYMKCGTTVSTPARARYGTICTSHFAAQKPWRPRPPLCNYLHRHSSMSHATRVGEVHP